MNSRVVWLVAALAGLLCVATPASADTPFGLRYSTNTQGAIALTGNTLMTCVNSCTAQNADGANNSFTMQRVDRDEDPSTANSSSAFLDLPAGAEVKFAGLYYGGFPDGPSGSQDRVKLAVRLGAPPCATATRPAYQTLGKPVVFEAIFPKTRGTTPVVRQYQGFVDVTGIVAAARRGCYTVGGVRLGITPAKDPDMGGGWALVVAYKDAGEPTRNLTVFDGMKFVGTKDDGGVPEDIDLSGFQTPPTGPVETSVGFVAYEGDRGNKDDYATLNGKRLGNTLNPPGPINGDFFNSSISINDVTFTQKDPNWLNQLGFDADLLGAPGYLTNNQKTTTIHLDTNGDGYAPGAISFATELYAPRLETTKTVAPTTAAQAGDRLTYTMSVRNTGLDAAADATLTDPIPPGSTYVPGSLRIGGVPKTDAAGDDAAEFDVTHRQVVFRLGRLEAEATDWQATVSFAVTVNEGLRQDATIVNVGTVGYTAETLKTPGEVDTPPTVTPVLVPDLAIKKTHAGDFAAGQTATFRLVVSNVGPVASRGTVTVTDTLRPQFSFTGNVTGPGWACETSGRTLSCARSDALAPGTAYPPIEFAARIDPDTDDEELFNTGVVAGGGDGNRLNNESTDSGKLKRPDLAVDKSADQTIVRAGGRATFTMRVANIGTADATAVELEDVLPDGLALIDITSSQGTCTPGPPITCKLGTLAVDAVATLHLTTLVDPALSGTPRLINRVSVDSRELDPNPGNNSDDASVDEVLALVDLVVEKLTATPTVPAGNDVAFTVTVRNAGLTTATGVRLQDALPAGLTVKSATPTQGTCTTGIPIVCNLGTLVGGGSAQIVVEATSNSALAGQTLTNVAEATADQGDGDPSDNRDSADVTFTSVPASVANVTVTKTASPTTVVVGEQVTFTIVATNDGPGTAADVVVTDTPNRPMIVVSADPSQGSCTTRQPVTCHLGSLAGGERATVVIRAIPLTVGTVGNGASAIAESSGDVDVAAVAAQAPSTAVRVTKRASRSTVRTGDTVTFAIRVRNAGRRVARNVRVCDRLPSELLYNRLGGARLRGHEACWTARNLAPGRSRVFALQARATSVARSSRVTNVALVRGLNFVSRTARARVTIVPDARACVARLRC